jgi:hypothetical protein
MRIAHTSMMPLVERLTIGSCAGASGSFFTSDSEDSGNSATKIHPPRPSDIEPGSYPNVLNGQRQAQNEFDWQRQQNTDRKKLKGQILEQARACQ